MASPAPSANYFMVVPFDPPLIDQDEKALTIATLDELLSNASCVWADEDDGHQITNNTGKLIIAMPQVTAYKDYNFNNAPTDLSEFKGTVIHFGRKDTLPAPYEERSRSCGKGLTIFHDHKNHIVYHSPGVGIRQSDRGSHSSVTVHKWEDPDTELWDDYVPCGSQFTANSVKVKTVYVGTHAIRSFRNRPPK